MSIKEKYVDGVVKYDVSVAVRSKLTRSVRVQLAKGGIATLREAKNAEKALLKEAAFEVARREGSGIPWEELLEKFELAHRHGDSTLRPVQLNTLFEMVSMLRKFAPDWAKLKVQEISPADVRQIINKMESDGYSKSRMKAFKSGVNSVYRWGLESGTIRAMTTSPAQSVKLYKIMDSSPPLILTRSEIERLLGAAKEVDHPWYPIWFMALHTGMRSGELFALEWSDVDLEGRIIMVSKSYNNRMDLVKSTKAGYWRNVPINDDLLEMLNSFRIKPIDALWDGKHVLPRLNRWANGEAAKFLRDFCVEIGITPVNFHSLRACFATHLLNAGVSSPVVKKICGWTEEKVMTRYIRLAGIDVAGSTNSLAYARGKNDDQAVLVDFSARRRSR